MVKTDIVHWSEHDLENEFTIGDWLIDGEDLSTVEDIILIWGL